jgi:hypothetical protein
MMFRVGFSVSGLRCWSSNDPVGRLFGDVSQLIQRLACATWSQHTPLQASWGPGAHVLNRNKVRPFRVILGDGAMIFRRARLAE